MSPPGKMFSRHYQSGLPVDLTGLSGLHGLPEPPGIADASALAPGAGGRSSAGAEGERRDSDAVLSLEQLQIAATDGSRDAALVLGSYLWSTGAEPRQGARWLRRAVAAGDANAAYILGLAYCRGQGVPKKLTMARRLYTIAAKAGIADAQLELSLLLSQGRSLDLAAARRWEARAAAQGHPRACLNRGARYARAKRPRFTEAITWYERAAEAGSGEAAARLCRMYLAGQGVARDEAVARRWFDRACALGHRWQEVGDEADEAASTEGTRGAG